jgi:hypothetical protein
VTFSPSSSCPLAPTATTGVAACTVTFPANPGTYTLAGAYGGDAAHLPSSTSTTVTIT